MRKKTYEKIKSILNIAKNQNKSFSEIPGVEPNYLSRLMAELKKTPEAFSDAKETIALYKELTKAHYSISGAKNRTGKYKADGIEADRAEVDQIRNDDGNIIRYDFKVYIRDKQPLIGSFSRDELTMVYRLYSAYGSSLTQREVSRAFPDYSLADFKRILRVFNITKASSPFPPHMMEEYTNEELLDIQFREKENDFLRNYENNRVRRCEQSLKEKAIENIELKRQLKELPNLINSIDLSNLTTLSAPTPTDKKIDVDLVIWLSDMHIGAMVSQYADYDNNYGLNEVKLRLTHIANELSLRFNSADSITICDLGDAIDGMDGQTCRRDHMLPQNMDNKEQFKAFIEAMLDFISKLRQLFPNTAIIYRSVGDSNHGGTYEWAAKNSLAQILINLGYKTYISDYFLEEFNINSNLFIITHGKDSRDMKGGFPLVLNDKTTNILTSYIMSNINPKDYDTITVVKGDLHQSATSYCNLFKYKSVGSLFGSSEWCQKNFGPTDARCDYSVIVHGLVLDGTINVQTSC